MLSLLLYGRQHSRYLVYVCNGQRATRFERIERETARAQRATAVCVCRGE